MAQGRVIFLLKSYSWESGLNLRADLFIYYFYEIMDVAYNSKVDISLFFNEIMRFHDATTC